MTVAEVVPITAALAVIGWLGALPLAGDRGDAGALRSDDRICLFQSAGREAFPRRRRQPADRLAARLAISCSMATAGHLAAAILLPLYYLADATITLLRRLVRREPVWQAHRTHFYQRATDRGFSVIQVVARVFFVNVALAALAMWPVIAPSRLSVNVALLGGAVLVALLLFAFARGRR